MITVYKYTLDPGHKYIELPKGAEFLTAEFQNHDLQLWAKVDTDNENEKRIIHVFGTGHEISTDLNSNLIFISTAFINGMVFHVFEEK